MLMLMLIEVDGSVFASVGGSGQAGGGAGGGASAVWRGAVGQVFCREDSVWHVFVISLGVLPHRHDHKTGSSHLKKSKGNGGSTDTMKMKLNNKA